MLPSSDGISFKPGSSRENTKAVIRMLSMDTCQFPGSVAQLGFSEMPCSYLTCDYLSVSGTEC